MTTTKLGSLCLRGHEVRALLKNGRVTVARAMKPQPHPSCSLDGCGWHWHPEGHEDHYVFGTDEAHLLEGVMDYCPFGKVGDRLVAKEKWAKPEQGVMSRDHDGSPIYAADYPPFVLPGFGPWRSPNCMPQAYSRLTVEVEAVRGKQNEDGVWQWLGEIRRVEV